MSRKERRSRDRENLRERLMPGSAKAIWPQQGEGGSCPLPRVLPLILGLLAEDELRGDMDLTRTYIGLCCESSGGVVEIDEPAFAGAAGFLKERGIRAWRDRVQKLEQLGFVKIFEPGAPRIEFVVILHPYQAIAKLHADGKIKAGWWDLYQQKLAEFGASEPAEATSAERSKRTTAFRVGGK
jgi:hypothetical protein